MRCIIVLTAKDHFFADDLSKRGEHLMLTNANDAREAPRAILF
ncbi:hypothetical protein CDS [Bradyrhizobium sp.]|nr:hypothetical protein CDS [Bradyrhizobium sp.]